MLTPALPAAPTAFADPSAVGSRTEASLIAFLGLLALLLSLSSRMLADPDTQWHIAVGRRIWEQAAVPWTDGLSHTFAGAPWIAKEWLSQLILYGAHRAAGWWGVAVLTAAALACAFALLFDWLLRRVRFEAALAILLIAVVLSAGQFLARPHALTLPVIIVWTSGLVGAAERRSAPPLWFALVMTLWANLHGSFTFGLGIAAILATEAVLAAPVGERAVSALRWGLFLGVSLLAACISPYGHHAMLVTATLFGSGESLPYIKEWQPLGFGPIGMLALGSALLLAAALARQPGRNAFRLLLLAILTLMMLRHVRFLGLFAVVAPIVCVGPLLRRFPGLARGEPVEPVGAGRLSPKVALGVLLAAAIGLALVIAPQPSPSKTPVAALDAARRLGVSGPVYNDYDFGGYLIAEGVPTFIDGRTDQLFLGGFITALNRAVDGDGLIPLLDRYGVSWALVRPGSGEIRQLDATPGWRRVYADAVAVVYVRRSP